MLGVGDFAGTFPSVSDCRLDSGAMRTEFDIVEFAGIALCIGLDDELGALCIAGALTGAGALGAECEMLGAEDAGGEKLGAGLGAGLGEGTLGADPVSWCWATATELTRRTTRIETVESRIQHLLPNDPGGGCP